MKKWKLEKCYRNCYIPKFVGCRSAIFSWRVILNAHVRKEQKTNDLTPVLSNHEKNLNPQLQIKKEINMRTEHNYRNNRIMFSKKTKPGNKQPEKIEPNTGSLNTVDKAARAAGEENGRAGVAVPWTSKSMRDYFEYFMLMSLKF